MSVTPVTSSKHMKRMFQLRQMWWRWTTAQGYKQLIPIRMHMRWFVRLCCMLINKYILNVWRGLEMDQQLTDEAQVSKRKPVAGLSNGRLWTCIDLQQMGASPAGLRSGDAHSPRPPHVTIPASVAAWRLVAVTRPNIISPDKRTTHQHEPDKHYGRMTAYRSVLATVWHITLPLWIQ